MNRRDLFKGAAAGAAVATLPAAAAPAPINLKAATRTVSHKPPALPVFPTFRAWVEYDLITDNMVLSVDTLRGRQHVLASSVLPASEQRRATMFELIDKVCQKLGKAPGRITVVGRLNPGDPSGLIR